MTWLFDKDDSVWGCQAYCEHGGVCKKDKDHSGLHSSGYCEWPDEKSLTRAEADAVVINIPGGIEMLEIYDTFIPPGVGDG